MPQPAKGFNLDLDLDRKWHVAYQLARYKYPEANKFVSELKVKDSSDRGRKAALAIEAVEPELETKRKWVSVLTQPKPPVTYDEARAVLSALFPLEQYDLAKRFESDFYSYVKTNGASDNEIFVDHVARTLVPLNCMAPQSDRLKTFLQTSSGFTPSVRKILRVQLQEDERCQSIRAAAATME